MRSHLPILSFFLTLISCSDPKQPADLVVHNGVVYTVDSAFSTAEAFAVKDGRIIATGKSDSILSHFEAKELIDARGKAVYPGFIDAHCHFYGYGQNLSQCDLVGTRSFDEVVQRVQDFAKTNPEGWLIGRGWDQNDWEVKQFPNRAKLDSLFPGRPVYLKRIDGHAALANKQALIEAGIHANTVVEGGSIEGLNRKGISLPGEPGSKPGEPPASLTGILVDNAMDLVAKVIPKPSKEEIRKSLLSAQANCFAVGLTTVDDAGLEKYIIDAIDELQKSGDLKMRIYAMLTDNKENLEHYLARGPYKTDRLNVCSFKFYADGALGSRGACLYSPYADSAGHLGFLLNKPQYFAENAHKMFGKGFQMNTHCIGDSSNGFILALWSGILNNGQPRWRIEHAQVIGRNDFELFKYAIPSVQPTHATSDMYWAKDRLGEERVKYAYAYKDLLKAAGMIALGTDFPVENINPMFTFYSAVARKDLKGFPEGGYQMENALTREETLKGMTIWAAYANFEEKEKGSLEPGKYADFVILSSDIMKITTDELPGVKVISTFVNGEKVFGGNND